jgi:hypothetical protein
MSIRIKLKDWDIVVLPFEGKVLGRLRKDGTRKEIYTGKIKNGYHRYHKPSHTPEAQRSRLVWFAVNGPIPAGMEINHINHQRDDDQITNLELVTCQQNNVYRRKGKNNTSGYKGVSWDKNANKYRAYIYLDNKKIHLGMFDCPIKAARAYDDAARKHYGKYAILNFPDSDKEVS